MATKVPSKKQSVKKMKNFLVTKSILYSNKRFPDFFYKFVNFLYNVVQAEILIQMTQNCRLFLCEPKFDVFMLF